ncbi:VPA1269 family protein [Pseudoalteromonas sp. BSi20439]|jgi:hypothetical protein|nr:VPA1269 family protein [Pseudoalteromonas sp. BSi20439]GAA70490.1 hypothetical protein P20439_0556 [Pseudoalteromonas sp. BSi20439]
MSKRKGNSSLTSNPPLNIPVSIKTLDEYKAICKSNGITNSRLHLENYKSIPGLVAHPERVFKDEWVSYKDTFDVPDFYSYDKLKNILKPLALQSQKEYRAFVKKQDDPQIPNDPQGVWESEWENWFKFLGKKEPYNLKFIAKPYMAWAVKIEEFMTQALGGGSKNSLLCRFVRIYIEKHDKSLTPEAFLTKQKVNIRPLKQELEKLNTDNMRRNLIIAVNEFLDFVITNDLTSEDEETGEIIRVMDARNPLSLLSNSASVMSPQRAESTKPCLQYYFVKKAQEWIIPANAKTFKDLKHLQKFDADWLKVSSKEVDRSDPDCVIKKIGDQLYMWSPINWLHTFTLTKVPLRGRQIAYNDSGEADDVIANVDQNGKIIWEKNKSIFSGLTKNQAFIKRMPDENAGMFITTNKTSNNGQGYSIPWIPEDLIYWLVKLRKWQQKYNPIDNPTNWSSCKRTNLNELQLKAKGINCFLFRAYQDIEPQSVGNSLTPRLAAALYNVQPSNLELATLSGKEATLNQYKSKYTPHSMRVSLITAYIMEMGMPIEIVMKVVGHSSIVMSIYYCKITQGDIRKRLEQGEKEALKTRVDATQSLIEQNKIEKVKNELVSNNEELLNSLTNSIPAGNFIFRDYGICPYAATRCEDGGELNGSGTSLRVPAPSGYLGTQNCLRCRHFITGPAFIGGLLSITNEILFHSNTQSSQCTKLQSKITMLEKSLDELDRREYVANLKNEKIDLSERKILELKIRKTESEYESAAKKMDMLLCDLQSSYKLIKMTQSIANQKDSLSLVKMSDSEIEISLEETSSFEQLQEVCENATIYESANASHAIIPRSQQLDKMAVFNEISPGLFLLTEEQQLHAGNQLARLLKSRLKTWSKVSRVINCDIKLSDLLGDEQISKSEIEFINKNNTLINSEL